MSAQPIRLSLSSIETKPAKGFCVTKNCTRPSVSRGLCQTCQMAAKRLIREGKTTWEQLEEMGLINPKKQGREGLFKNAFESASGMAVVAAVKAGKSARKVVRHG